jgi:hypothetical protein
MYVDRAAASPHFAICVNLQIGMQSSASPAGASKWLCARPSLRAGWLQARNAWRRWPLAGAAVVLCLVGLGLAGRISIVKRALEAMSDGPLLVVALTAAVSGAITLRRRRRLASSRHRDWLASLPSDLSLTTRAAFAALPIWCGLVFVAFTASMAAGLPLSVPGVLALAILAGHLVAVPIVMLMVGGAAQRERRRLRAGRRSYQPPQSRFARVRRVRSRWATHAQLLPLGYWPVARTRLLNRPKKRARGLAFLLIGMPLDIPGAVALAAAGAWLVTFHLINLVLGVIRVAFAASWWLAPTPVGAVRFAAAVSHRALAGEIYTCTLLVAAVYAIKGTRGLDAAILPMVAWVGAVCLVCATTCIFAMQTRSVARSALHQWLR